jgi:hypothetical protein
MTGCMTLCFVRAGRTLSVMQAERLAEHLVLVVAYYDRKSLEQALTENSSRTMITR